LLRGFRSLGEDRLAREQTHQNRKQALHGVQS
jgi:hypothetical protein